MEKKVYTGAIIAWSGTEFKMAAAWVIADKETTAVGEMLKMGKDAYPRSAGWRNHQVAVCVVPATAIQEVSQ